MKKVALTVVLVLLVSMTALMVISSSHMEELPAIRTDGVTGCEMNKVDGSIAFYIRIEFDMNRFFSRYNVKMLLDGKVVGTIYHGKSYEGMLGVSEGYHTLTFANADNPSIQGSSQLKIVNDSDYTCTIHAHWNHVAIRDEYLDGVPVDHEAVELEQFIGTCESLDYETASRYPEQTTGKKVRITGKVTRTVDLPLVDLSLIAVADANSIWFVIYRRNTQPQTGRILPGDVITVYGECKGLSNFLMGNGLLFEDWTTAVPAIASRYIVRNH